MSIEQTVAVEEEFGDIDKKFDDSKCTEILALLTKGICSEKSFNHVNLNETVKHDETGEDDIADTTEALECEN